jgi:hypothetical protein
LRRSTPTATPCLAAVDLPGLRARWLVEALEEAAGQIAERCGHKDYRGRGGDTFEERWAPPKIWLADRCPFCSKDTELVRALADEYRDGKR